MSFDKMTVNKKTLFVYLLICLLAFLLAYWFDRYYIYSEKDSIIKIPMIKSQIPINN